jgi:hypothetical protein
MADLKNIDAEALTKTIEKAGEDAEASLRYAVKAALETVREAAAALGGMPKSTSDLLTQAQVCFVREFTVHATRVRAEVSFGGDGSYRMSDQEDPAIPAGRYRAIFVLLPLDRK